MTGHLLVRDQFDVSFAFDPELGRLGVAYTGGLARQGFPELSIEPPPAFDLPADLDWPGAAVFLGQALAEVAESVLGHGTLSIPSTLRYLGSEPVRFRVTSAAETLGPVSTILAGAGEMRQVACSWWSA